MTNHFRIALSLMLLALTTARNSSAQVEGEEEAPLRPTAWVRDAEDTPSPDAEPTPWAAERPQYRRRHSQHQIAMPEADPDTLRKEQDKGRAQDEFDSVFGQ